MATNEKKIDPALLDELLKDQDPQTVFSSEGLLGELKKALVRSHGHFPATKLPAN
jgi:hypothetical protein